MGLGAYFRLMRAGFVLAREGAFSLAEDQPIPPSAKALVGFARLSKSARCAGPARGKAGQRSQPARPHLCQLGQLLATRRDIVGPDVADI